MMRRSNPSTYTVLIAKSGRSPLTLLVKPGPLLLLLTVAIAAPIAWLGNRVYSLSQQNQLLTNENQELSQAANDVFREIEVLDEEISTLRERAGLDDVDGEGEGSAISPQSTRPTRSPSPKIALGGPEALLEPSETLDIAKDRLPELATTLDEQVKPALDETLAAEFARSDAKPNIPPVKGAVRISSKFGLRPNPFGWGYETHRGIDFPGPVGAPIYATAPGTVKKADWGRGYGYHVIVDHGYGYETLYAHLSELTVSSGESVARNDVIGLLGNTGRSTGPHLHYEVSKDNKVVDPELYLD